MSRLILIRHAMPAIAPDIPADRWSLSREGIEQARRLAAHPALTGAGRLYASAEPKALSTAAPIAARLGLPARTAPGLGEQRRPVLPYTDVAARQQLIAEMFAHPRASIMGCEPIAAAQRRIVACLQALLRRGDDLIVVSHGTVLHLYLSALLRIPADAACWARIGVPDLAVVDPGRRQVLRDFGGGL